MKKFTVQWLVLWLLFSGISVAQSVWPIPDWKRAAPESQGLDTERLSSFIQSLRTGQRYPNIHSLLIVRNGWLIVEEYFNGWSQDRLHAQQSVSKSVTSALIGIALKQGHLESLDQRALEFFPDYEIENRDRRKEEITLYDLLTMRTGTDYEEGYPGSPHSKLNSLSGGWDRFVLNRPMIRWPGSQFQYDSGGVILLSSILKRVSGLHADQYADRFLFPRIGITKARWFKNQEGHPHTGGGLYLRPVDMARFGLLYLRNGRWGSDQVLDREWVDVSLTSHVTFSGRGHTIGYGYLWWVLEPPARGSTPIYSARGFKGQHIFLIPDFEMVVVVTAGERGPNMHDPIQFLYSEILPCLDNLR